MSFSVSEINCPYSEGDEVVVGSFNKYGKKQNLKIKHGYIYKILSPPFKGAEWRAEVKCNEEKGIQTYNIRELYDSKDACIRHLNNKNVLNQNLVKELERCLEKLRYAKLDLAKNQELIATRKEIIEEIQKNM